MTSILDEEMCNFQFKRQAESCPSRCCMGSRLSLHAREDLRGGLWGKSEKGKKAMLEVYGLLFGYSIAS